MRAAQQQPAGFLHRHDADVVLAFLLKYVQKKQCKSMQIHPLPKKSFPAVVLRTIALGGRRDLVGSLKFIVFTLFFCVSVCVCVCVCACLVFFVTISWTSLGDVNLGPFTGGAKFTICRPGIPRGRSVRRRRQKNLHINRRRGHGATGNGAVRRFCISSVMQIIRVVKLGKKKN